MIKSISIFALTVMAFPSVALACGSGGCGRGGGHYFLGVALMALLAVLGLWVLRNAEKDPKWIKWAGRVVGWLLVVIGLLGFLCGALSHGMKQANGYGNKKCAQCAKARLGKCYRKK